MRSKRQFTCLRPKIAPQQPLAHQIHPRLRCYIAQLSSSSFWSMGKLLLTAVNVECKCFVVLYACTYNLYMDHKRWNIALYCGREMHRHTKGYCSSVMYVQGKNTHFSLFHTCFKGPCQVFFYNCCCSLWKNAWMCLKSLISIMAFFARFPTVLFWRGLGRNCSIFLLLASFSAMQL